MKKTVVVGLLTVTLLGLLSEARVSVFQNSNKIASLEAENVGIKAALKEIHKDVREIRRYLMGKKR